MSPTSKAIPLGTALPSMTLECDDSIDKQEVVVVHYVKGVFFPSSFR